MSTLIPDLWAAMRAAHLSHDRHAGLACHSLRPVYLARAGAYHVCLPPDPVRANELAACAYADWLEARALHAAATEVSR